MRCRVDKTHDQRNKTGFANIANFVGSVDIDWHSFPSYSSSSLWARSLIMDPSLDRTRRRRETTRSKLRYYKTNILQSETRFSKARIISYQSDTFYDRRVGLRWQGLPLGQPLAPSDSSGSTSRVASETHFRPSSARSTSPDIEATPRHHDSGETKLIDPAGAEFPPSADIRARAKPTGEARCFTSSQSMPSFDKSHTSPRSDPSFDRPSLPASRCLPATSARLHNDPSGTDRPTKSGGGTARWWWWCVAANLESFIRAASSFARARDWLSSGRLSQRRAWHRVETVEKLIQYNTPSKTTEEYTA
ncbi:hypothetical protein PCL_10576 [Purpureocillium lilacinum]|uniref:Uncharacterized protein n=1 Tax=Purpureocillium lilacinum TaxID=33203 RepID=A0A2U3EBW9_PURLI|nr:hypothetical protein Purlil1_9169 [Purpureocillium lilacinum]PWI71953.1 hypothetical protein PCL_10576 [Purpureocillium lilacinum]